MKTTLIPCRSCGAKLSPSADRCPQCGEKFSNIATTALNAVGLLVFILGGFCLFGGNMPAGIILILIGAGMSFGGGALKKAGMR